MNRKDRFWCSRKRVSEKILNPSRLKCLDGWYVVASLIATWGEKTFMGESHSSESFLHRASQYQSKMAWPCSPSNGRLCRTNADALLIVSGDTNVKSFLLPLTNEPTRSDGSNTLNCGRGSIVVRETRFPDNQAKQYWALLFRATKEHYVALHEGSVLKSSHSIRKALLDFLSTNRRQIHATDYAVPSGRQLNDVRSGARTRFSPFRCGHTLSMCTITERSTLYRGDSPPRKLILEWCRTCAVTYAWVTLHSSILFQTIFNYVPALQHLISGL